MGCIGSKEQKLEKIISKPLRDGGGEEVPCIETQKKRSFKSFDSRELRVLPAKGSGAGKVPEANNILGKAGMAGLEKAVEVLDTLGSSMSSLNASSGFALGVTARGNKILILAFEVANTIAKGANLWRSLSDENIKLLKEDILQSEGVRKLVSADVNELLFITAADKRKELDLYSREVIRFGDLCKDPIWHNLDRYLLKLSSDVNTQEQSKEEVEATMQVLINLAHNTSELYHELHALDRFEQDYKLKFQEEESLPSARRESLQILNTELKRQRKLVKSLQKKTLWSRNLEEIVEKLVDIVTYLYRQISVSFVDAGNTLSDYEPVQNQRLGACGLALHYANIIIQIDNIVSRPLSLPPTARDTLYHALPQRVKGALRSKLQSFELLEEFSVAQIKAEMQKTLGWMVPIADNTIRSHQGFGWVGEWANMGTEINKKQGTQQSISYIQTLYHADKEKTEDSMLELVIWLHHLVIQVRNRGYGFKPLNPVQSHPVKVASSAVQDPKEELSLVHSGGIHKAIIYISEDEQLMLDSMRPRRITMRRSKSLDFDSRKEIDTALSSRSCSNSPDKDFSCALDMKFQRRKVLDVMDGLGTLDTLVTSPIIPLCT